MTAPPSPTSAELAAWARESLAAGDPLDEVAQACGRPPQALLAELGVAGEMGREEAYAAELWAAGVTQEEIGRLQGLSRTAVSLRLRSLRARGYAVRMGGPSRPLHKRNEAILRAIHAGLSAGEVVKRMKLTPGVVAGVIHRAKVSPLRPSPLPGCQCGLCSDLQAASHPDHEDYRLHRANWREATGREPARRVPARAVECQS